MQQRALLKARTVAKATGGGAIATATAAYLEAEVTGTGHPNLNPTPNPNPNLNPDLNPNLHPKQVTGDGIRPASEVLLVVEMDPDPTLTLTLTLPLALTLPLPLPHP